MLKGNDKLLLFKNKKINKINVLYYVFWSGD